MKIAAHNKLVMIGDSITDCGRAKPVGEGIFNALGNGYVSVIDVLFSVAYPELGIRVVNMGTSGNTVRDLKARWQTDVIDLKPDWVSIMIGINDVWRQFDSPRQTEIAVLPDEYRATLDELVAQASSAAKQIVLMSPFHIEPNKRDAMRARMDEYGAIVREIAHRRDALFVDTQAAFDAALEHFHPYGIAWDRIHPGPSGANGQFGHTIIARAFLNAIDYRWS